MDQETVHNHQNFVFCRTNIFHAYALHLGGNAGKAHDDNLVTLEILTYNHEEKDIPMSLKKC